MADWTSFCWYLDFVLWTTYFCWSRSVWNLQLGFKLTLLGSIYIYLSHSLLCIQLQITLHLILKVFLTTNQKFGPESNWRPGWGLKFLVYICVFFSSSVSKSVQTNFLTFPFSVIGSPLYAPPPVRFPITNGSWVFLLSPMY